MTDSNAPLLHSRCLIADGSSLLTSAYLYPTHIEIKGWTWSGRVSRRISLHEVTQIRWWAGVNGKSKRRLLPVNLELTLEDTRFSFTCMKSLGYGIIHCVAFVKTTSPQLRKSLKGLARVRTQVRERRTTKRHQWAMPPPASDRKCS